ncbi:MAG: hypothetical protein V3R96_03465, partial [Dehalococcoidales bacterium]
YSKDSSDLAPLPTTMEEILRIPYEGIEKRPGSGMGRGPILILTVSTPSQGDFTIKKTVSYLDWP